MSEFESAVSTAQRALIWMSDHPEAMGRFLDASGIAPGELRARVADPEFLGFVLDFMLADEPMLLEFCAVEGCAPGLPARARMALPGGDLPNWT